MSGRVLLTVSSCEFIQALFKIMLFNKSGAGQGRVELGLAAAKRLVYSNCDVLRTRGTFFSSASWKH